MKNFLLFLIYIFCNTAMAQTSKYITDANFSDIVTTVYNNSFDLRVDAEKFVVNQIYTTGFSDNGLEKNLPVTFKLISQSAFSVHIPLSKNFSDIETIKNDINKLFVNTTAINKKMKNVALTYSEKSDSYSDVYVENDFGITITIAKNAEQKTVGLSFTKMMMNNKKLIADEKFDAKTKHQKIEPAQPTKPVLIKPTKKPKLPTKITTFNCKSLDEVVKASFIYFKGNAIDLAKTVPGIELYNTNLPSLGFNETYKVSRQQLEGAGVVTLHFYLSSSTYKTSDAAEKTYQNILKQLKKCYTETLSETKNNVSKMSTLNITKDKNKVLIALQLFKEGDTFKIEFVVKLDDADAKEGWEEMLEDDEM